MWLQGPWDNGLLSIYDGLDRAQATVLVRLRSGNILHNQQLHRNKINSIFAHQSFAPSPLSLSHVLC